MPASPSKLKLHLSADELALLRSLAFPGSRDALAGAKETSGGYVVTGTRRTLDDLVGWVAGEANDSSGRRAELLHRIADQLETVLELHAE
jgi:hypothetical protein